MRLPERYCLRPVAASGELAWAVTSRTWPRCTAFELRGYLFLNRTLDGDAADYYVVRRKGRAGRDLLVDGITFGWCSFDKALHYIEEAVQSRDRCGSTVSLTLESTETHGTCDACRGFSWHQPGTPAGRPARRLPQR